MACHGAPTKAHFLNPHPTAGFLLLLALFALGLLVALVTWRKWNAFIALLLASMLVGIGAGLPPLAALVAFQEGLGATLGGIAGILALGAMLGKLLAESGGALALADRLNAMLGPRLVLWCVVAMATLVGLVTWFTVGLLLLLPVVVMLARQSRQPLMLLAIPMLAFLSVLHGLTPPHPGPVVAMNALRAETGRTLAFALLVGLPTALVAGPLLAPLLLRFAPNASPPLISADNIGGRQVSASSALFIILLPVSLMLLTLLNPKRSEGGWIVEPVLKILAHPTIALLIALGVAILLIRRACGFSRSDILKFTEQSVAAIGMTLLVVGAGGGFARVLRDAGVATALGEVMGRMSFPPLLYAWLLAAFIRVATGSATVAITTAAGLLLPMLAENPGLPPELFVLALGFGSLFLSHLNDGGFWIVKESLGLTVGETLRTWTVVETVIGIVGLAFTLLLSTIL
ncbi:MAG TPA: gluconate:H+ symporter [Methylomirabilota bacterium]|nr:gluconate:H+ symporter [Methylomirabilota bacterium]